MNIIERIISQEVDRYVKAVKPSIPFFSIIDKKVMKYLYEPNKKAIILLVNREDYIKNYGLYKAIRKFLEVYPPFKKFMRDLGVEKYSILYAFPHTEGSYKSFSKTSITPISNILTKEEGMKLMINSVDNAKKKIELLNDSLQALSKKAEENKKIQLQFLLELILSQTPQPTNKAIIDDYDLYKLLYNLYTHIYGNIPKKRNIQAVITDENAELFKTIIDRHFLVNWDNVEGKTMRDKVINVLLKYGFGATIEIIASVDFEMTKLLAGGKKGKKGKKSKGKSKSKKKVIKEEATKELEIEQLPQDEEEEPDEIEEELSTTAINIPIEEGGL